MNSEKKVHVGIIGLGAIGERMINGFQMNENITLAAVTDVSAERAEQVSGQLGGIPYFTDHRAMLAEVELDLIYVAVPPIHHEAIAIDVIRANKHILCEKPLANSIEEATVMLAAAQSAGVVHAINFPLNYQRSMIQFGELIDKGYAGELRRIDLIMNFPQWPRAWQQNAWVGGKEQGGFVLEVGAHYVQAILKYFGQIVHTDSVLQFPTDPNASENSIIAVLTLASGLKVHISGISQFAGDEHIALTAYGTEGTVSLENWRTLKAGKIGKQLVEINAEDIPQSHNIIENLVRAIRGEQADLYDFQVGYDVQVVLDTLRKK